MGQGLSGKETLHNRLDQMAERLIGLRLSLENQARSICWQGDGESPMQVPQPVDTDSIHHKLDCLFELLAQCEKATTWLENNIGYDSRGPKSPVAKGQLQG